MSAGSRTPKRGSWLSSKDPTLVIGLGRFGRALAETLADLGHEVMGVDTSPRIVQSCSVSLTHVVQADATDIEALRQIGATDFPRAVIAIGTDVQASILATYSLVDLKMPRIWAKAITAEHGAILERVGAHKVVFPERDMGTRVARTMVGRTIDDMFPKLPATIGEPRLEIRDLWRKPFTLGVSLTVHAGEIVGVAGLVGSGRSELAQAIFGITPPQSGQIAIDGRPVKIRHPGDAMKLGIAYVPEERGSQGLIRQMNIRENVSLAILRQLTRGPFIDRAGDKTLAQRTIDQLNIRAYSINQVVNKLSGGNQQKVVIGKWLACQPRILIMDEPTRGIDVGAKAEVHRLMSQLAQQGMAVLMISSELPEILGMSDRIVVMREGEVVGEFAREEATQEKIATAMMSVEAGNGGADVASLEPATAASGDR